MAELPKGPVGENTPGKPVNMPGVYRHEASGKEVIVLQDSINGSPVTAQADALVRLGFVKVAEPPTRQELLAMQEAQAKKDAEAEAAGEQTGVYEAPAPEAPKFNGTASDLQAELDAAKQRAAEAEAALAAVQAANDAPVEPSANVATQDAVQEAPEPSVAPEQPAEPEAQPEADQNQTKEEGK